MGFGNSTPTTYFKIKNGYVAISIKPEDESKYQNQINAAKSTRRYKNKIGNDMIDIQFGWFEGRLESIRLSESEFNGIAFKQWNIRFIGDSGDYYTWATYHNSALVQGFVNCLASVEGELGKIRLLPYEKDGKTRMVVYNDGKKLQWAYQPGEFPALEKIMIMNPKSKKQEPLIRNGKVVLDDSERLKWLETEIEEINNRLKLQSLGVDDDYAPSAQTSDPSEHASDDFDGKYAETTDEIPF